jgi:5-methylcytosine-specific restriction protein A
MMGNFDRYSLYSLKSLNDKLGMHLDPSEISQRSTDYAQSSSHFVLFLTLDTTLTSWKILPGYDDHSLMSLEWFGRPNAHSAQLIFKDLFHGPLEPLVFLKWNLDSTFLFLGSPVISEFKDAVVGPEGRPTIRVIFDFPESVPIEGAPGWRERAISAFEGRKRRGLESRAERSPKLRKACIAHYGPTCQICGFNFAAKYGPIGRNFCHVHHLKELAELSEEVLVDAVSDLLPVCANCHAMLHVRFPAFLPEELRSIMSNNPVPP